MTQPTDETPGPELEQQQLIERQNRSILNQLNRIEATLDGVAETLAADTDDPVT